MNKRVISLIIFSMVSLKIILSQETFVNNLNSWKETTEYIPFLSLDLSVAFYYECCSYLGVIGENKYKMNIRFDSVLKQENRVYKVIGKQLLNNNVIKFEGSLSIEHLELISYSSESQILILAIIGDFTFQEIKKSTIQISGVYRKYISYNPMDTILISNTINIELGSSEGFAGLWSDNSTGETKPCFFGFYRYPSIFTGDFDAGGEPNIDEKYKKYGWEQFFERKNGFGAYFNLEYDNVWWR